MQSSVTSQLTASVGGQAAARRLFAPPIQALEVTAQDNQIGKEVDLVWRTNACHQLRIIRGTCPASNGQVMMSQSTAQPTSWHLGQRIRLVGWEPLTITGIYQVPHLNADYWFNRSATYFPMEEPTPIPTGGGIPTPQSGGSIFDALFTPIATMTSGSRGLAQGTAVIDDLMLTRNLQPADVPVLQSGITSLIDSPALTSDQITVTSSIPTTFATLQASWRAVEVPVFLITVQLLTLSWLLLFLSVTDAVEARGPEVALAKLRGHGRLRTVLFGLSEPTALLLLALPLGALVGWAATSVLGKVLLSPGTAVGLPSLGWIAAAVATAGGLAAVILAARRTLRRPVVEQWRRSGRRATDRGWVIDAILLTGAVAGLLDLLFTGQISSASHNVLSLLVPGLLGLAIAVAASRILPMACRAFFNAHGQARRARPVPRGAAHRQAPGRGTDHDRARDRLRARRLRRHGLVRRPRQLPARRGRAGRRPDGAESHCPGGPGPRLDGRQGRPRRAAWRWRWMSTPASPAAPPAAGRDPRRGPAALRPDRQLADRVSPPAAAALMARIDPPAPTRPVVLNGNAFRVRVRVGSLSLPGLQFAADVTTGASPVSLGTLPGRGTVTRTGQLVGCPCMLQDLSLSQTGRQLARHLRGPIQGNLTLIACRNTTAAAGRPSAPGSSSSGHCLAACHRRHPAGRDHRRPGRAQLAVRISPSKRTRRSSQPTGRSRCLPWPPPPWSARETAHSPASVLTAIPWLFIPSSRRRPSLARPPTA